LKRFSFIYGRGGEVSSLRQRIELVEKSGKWLNDMATEHHYMHRPIHQRAVPFGWGVMFDGELYQEDKKPSGFIVFASIHFTQLKDEFGKPGLPTKWQVLSLSRLWLHDNLPRNSETCVIAKALKLVQKRWLEVHPPRHVEQPYHIVKIISYADTRFHQGIIYRAANFRESGRTVSAKRHKNSMGAGMDGAELIRFIYDLDEPRWKFKNKQMDLMERC
jgi:hypothetical protein